MTDFGYIVGRFFTESIVDGLATEAPREGRLSFYPAPNNRASILSGVGNNPEAVPLVEGKVSVAVPVGSYHVLFQIDGLPYAAVPITVESKHVEFNPFDLNKELGPKEPVLDEKPDYIKLFREGV